MPAAPRCRVSRTLMESKMRFLGVASAILLLASAPLRAASQATVSPCAAQLTALGQSADWIDAATTADACTKTLCTSPSHTDCVSAQPPKENLLLVFSDEFNTDGRAFGVGAADKRWTAQNTWYAGTDDMEIYREEQITTQGGSAVITMQKVAPNTSYATSQQPDGTVWNVTKNYTSGFFSSWNKFCFTGGYVEAKLLFPGDHFISGFWPAFWLMGNMGRAGLMKSTGGVWPYTYNACTGGDVGLELPGANKPQLITACNGTDPPGLNRTALGLALGVGRGAPEIDIVEMKVPSSLNESNNLAPIPTDTPLGGGPGQKPYPFNSMTLQWGPLLPNGTTWMDPTYCPCSPCCDPANVSNYAPGCNYQGPLGPGMFLPQDQFNVSGSPVEGMWTHATYWDGDFADGLKDQLAAQNLTCLLQNIRPGNLVQDAVSVMATLTPEYYEQSPNATYHTFGLDWHPEQYIRWYINGVLVYELNETVSRAQNNGTYSTGERPIPVEAMYILLNFAMSNNFTRVDIDRLTFPSQYKIDYVRVYQSQAALNIGCSPPAYPTAQYLACKRDTYLISQEEQVLIPDVCQQLPYCKSEWGYEYVGGDLTNSSGVAISYNNVSSPQDCCDLCKNNTACGAFVWNPYYFPPSAVKICTLKLPTGWNRTSKMGTPYEGIISGVVYNAASTSPRGAAAAG